LTRIRLIVDAPGANFTKLPAGTELEVIGYTYDGNYKVIVDGRVLIVLKEEAKIVKEEQDHH
jgi:hypothetical protein